MSIARSAVMLTAMLAMWLGQSFQMHDLVVVALLVVLEGTLSVDNALVLGLLARRLPQHQRAKALTYGLVGAFVFRFLAIAAATFLLKWTVFKLLGGGYLLFVALKHFYQEWRHEKKHEHVRLDPDGQAIVDAPPSEGATPELPGQLSRPFAAFWPTVFVIEMTDIAFAVDSIVAAIGVVGPVPAGHPTGALHPKLWVVILGGFIGVILMRFAAVIFIRLLDRFPRFEIAAYLLVLVIGLKLVVDFVAHQLHWNQINFHSTASPAFWTFWIVMLLCFSYGFLGRRHQN